MLAKNTWLWRCVILYSSDKEGGEIVKTVNEVYDKKTTNIKVVNVETEKGIVKLDEIIENEVGN